MKCHFTCTLKTNPCRRQCQGGGFWLTTARSGGGVFVAESIWGIDLGNFWQGGFGGEGGGGLLITPEGYTDAHVYIIVYIYICKYVTLAGVENSE